MQQSWVVIAVVGMLVAGQAFGTGQDVSTRKDSALFTLMTYNIHHGEGMDDRLDLDRIARIIRGAGPDVVCLQEVDRGVPRSGGRDIARELAAALEMEFVFGENLALDGGGYGNAVLSRFPIVGHENLALPGPEGAEPRGCLVARVRVGSREIVVANTHFGLNAAEREDQAEAILERLPRAGAVVLAGDLNEPLRAPALRLLATGFTPAETAKDCAQPHTFPAPAPHHRIDHVFTSAALTTSDTCVLAGEESAVASDHFPVVTAIRLVGARDGAAED